MNTGQQTFAGRIGLFEGVKVFDPLFLPTTEEQKTTR